MDKTIFMNTIALKQKALELINHADEEELLAVIDMFQQPLHRKYQYTEGDMNEWKEISAKYEFGETPGYTI